LRWNKALNLEDEIGSIQKAKKADIILVDLRNPRAAPVLKSVPSLVYYANGGDVTTVIIDGKLVMEEREIKTVDEDEAVANAEMTARRIIDRGGMQDLLRDRWPSC
jgi:5-methylthioadenosine/S-adenosylhomocysteine deaminase